MYSRDFTFKKYQELCEKIKDSGYTTFTMKEFFEKSKQQSIEDLNFIILRHDIDNKVDSPFALEMAKFEQSLNISSTYYFRTVPSVFDIKLIEEISKMGHEIGYHYESLNESKGDLPTGFGIFKSNLEKMRKIAPVVTIAQHGGSLGDLTATTFFDLIKTSFYLLLNKNKIKCYESKAIWRKYSFEDLGILGEAYLSLDFNKIFYFSDTGIRWDAFNNRTLDHVDAAYYSPEGKLVRTTDDLIELIDQKKIRKICILTHPPNWRDPWVSWIKWQFLQKFRNFGKNIFLKN